MNFINKNCWDKDLLEEYFTTESRQKNKEIFNETHLEIDKIYLLKKPLEYQADFISETEFLNLILLKTQIKAKKKIYIFEGETGSGKSELCQWIEYNLVKDRVPILFTRTNTNIKQIFNKLSEHSTEEYDVRGNLEVYDIENLINYLNNECKLYYDEQKSKDQKTRELKGNLLTYYRKIIEHQDFFNSIRKNLEEYQSSGEKLLKSYEPIKTTQLRAIIKDKNIRAQGENAEKLLYFIKIYLDTIFINRFGCKKDIQEILINISEKYEKERKRVVLIFEDITSMGIYKDQILQFIFDKAECEVDIIIGVTTGFVRENKIKESTKWDRTDAFLSLTSEKGFTYFLENNENIINLTLKYMRAIKKYCQNCSEKNDCFKIFGQYLFPFTKEVLIKIYKNLIDNNVQKRTPRLFLEKVQKKILYDKIFPFENSFIKEMSGFFLSTIRETSPDFIKVFDVFGEETKINNDIYLSVPKKIFKFFSFNLDSPKLKKLPLHDEDNILSLKTKKEIDSEVRDKEKQDPEENKELDLLEKKRENFSKWMSDGDQLLYGEELRNGIIKLFDSKYQFLELKSSTSNISGINYNYSGKIPLHIVDVDKLRSEDIIRLDIQRQSEYNLLDFSFEHGIRSFSDGIGLNSISFLESNYLLIDWIDNNFNSYNKKLIEHIENNGLIGLNLEVVAIFMKNYIQNVFFGRDMLEWNNLTEDLTKKEIPRILNYCSSCNSYLNDVKCLKCETFSNPILPIKNLKSLENQIEIIEQFFQIIFNLGKGIRNYNLLSKYFDIYRKDFMNIRTKISSLKYNNINSKIVFKLQNKTEIQIKKILEIFQEAYNSQERKITKNFVTHLSVIVEKLNGIYKYSKDFSEDLLKEKLNELKDSFFPKDWNSNWTEKIKLDDVNFTNFFKNVKSSITLFNKIQQKKSISIFDINIFINKIINTFSSTKEYIFLNTLSDGIFKKVNNHKILLNNQDYKEHIELSNKNLESYKIALKEIKEDLEKI